LVKLIACVNFTNSLQAAFWCKSVLLIFSLITARLCKFLVKEYYIGAKTAHKMLVKLTAGVKCWWNWHQFDAAYTSGKLLIVMRTNPETNEPSVSDEDLKDFQTISEHVRTFQYLEERNPNFWRKLYFYLPHKRRNMSFFQHLFSTNLRNLFQNSKNWI